MAVDESRMNRIKLHAASLDQPALLLRRGTPKLLENESAQSHARCPQTHFGTHRTSAIKVIRRSGYWVGISWGA
jgi:hypothetical protein